MRDQAPGSRGSDMKPFEEIVIRLKRCENFVEISVLSEGTGRVLVDKLYVSESSSNLIIEVSTMDIEFRLKT